MAHAVQHARRVRIEQRRARAAAVIGVQKVGHNLDRVCAAEQRRLLLAHAGQVRREICVGHRRVGCEKASHAATARPKTQTHPGSKSTVPSTARDTPRTRRRSS